jgi:putative ABC transport system ATP-binding protein
MGRGICVELRGVSRRFREGGVEHVVLRDLDARFEPGELAVVLGRSGSGKTTLLNLIAGLDLPDAGEVCLDERSLGRLGERERTLLRRRQIGFVFQSFNLIPTLSVGENVRLPLELDGDTARARARAAELLERVGLAGRSASFPDQLSGGEQQRVAIARALASEPGLILADEPTGNLDLETGRQVLDVLDEMVSAHGATLLMATHSAEVMGRASRLLELRGGRLQEVGR